MKIRYINTLIQESLQHFPAVLLIGARQVGKSTLAEQLVAEKILSDYVTLDDYTQLEAARNDPDGFLEQFKTSVALDEVQRVPDLLRALKKIIDQKRTSGQFLLTGSANILSYPGVSESLAGRMDIIHLEGMSAGELAMCKTPSKLLEELFDNDSVTIVNNAQKHLKTAPPLTKTTLREKVFFGGFPELALKNNARFNSRWFAAYQTAYIERDVRDLTKLTDPIPFSKLLKLAALRTGNLLNVKNLSVDVGIDQRTTGRYLELLELTFQINQLIPWHANSRKRLVKTPKIYINDAGFACYLAGIDQPEMLENHPFWGALLETWVWAEIRKQLALMTPNIEATYYRTHQGREVDFVLQKGSRCVGVEIKSSTSVTSKDFLGLIDMQSAMKEEAIGVVLYMGDNAVHFGKNLMALPLRCLIY